MTKTAKKEPSIALSVTRGLVAAGFACLTAWPALAEAPKTLKPGVITIGSDLVYPPYDVLENGQAKGFDADVMALLAPELGMKPDFVDTRFASLIPGLRSDKFDMIASALYMTAARAEIIDYVPYATTGGALIVRKSDAFSPKAATDLCGKRVGTLKGAAWVPDLQKISTGACGGKAMTVQEFPTSAEAAQALLANAVDVEFDDTGVSKATVAASGDRLRITSDAILFPVVMGLGVRKGDEALLAALRTSFAKIHASGEYAKLLDKYSLKEPTEAEVKASLTPKPAN